ncbi:hypothetical protein [Varibaculum prostatecancerukia]|uniref:hypothetical protein n=1 Tax=Varibaculum prostatecancerukia TaxID=2811781 RepID=UPI002868C847|nr:hypothetical protein [Varibaculum prostatecancerukia]
MLVGQARSGINKRLDVSLNRIDSHRNSKGFEIIAANLHAIAGLVGGQLARAIHVHRVEYAPKPSAAAS